MNLLRAIALSLLAIVPAGAASAADLSPPVNFGLPSIVDRFEFRLGGFAHGLGSVERNTSAVSLELVTPRLFPAVSDWWGFLLPRTYVAGMINVNGATSSVRAGANWLFPFTEQIFSEIYFGGAVHDGSLVGSADQNALGSRVLFNVGGSLGYRFAPRWSAIATFDHLSNGNRVFATGFARNQGINSVGARLSYAF